MKTVFEFQNYQSYLHEALSEGSEARGKKAALSKYLNCQSSYISQVLAERTHLSLEQAIKTSDFLKHSSEEKRFFLILVQKDRSGSVQLETFFKEQLKEIQEKRLLVRERIQVKDQLSSSDQATYYSLWWYVAIHILSAFSQFNTREKLAQKLNLSLEVVDTALDFLVSRELVTEKSGELSIGKKRIHLDAKSPLIARHHTNWRMKAVESVEKQKSENLHYSAMIGISKKDAAKIRSMLLDFLQETETIIKKSDVEAPYVLLLDLFDV